MNKNSALAVLVVSSLAGLLTGCAPGGDSVDKGEQSLTTEYDSLIVKSEWVGADTIRATIYDKAQTQRLGETSWTTGGKIGYEFVGAEGEGFSGGATVDAKIPLALEASNNLAADTYRNMVTAPTAEQSYKAAICMGRGCAEEAYICFVSIYNCWEFCVSCN